MGLFSGVIGLHRARGQHMSGTEKNSVRAKGRVLESPNNLWEKNVEDKIQKHIEETGLVWWLNAQPFESNPFSNLEFTAFHFSDHRQVH